MEREGRLALIIAVAQTVIAHQDQLTRLDQAIGDGDHGVNMQRGFEAVLSEARSWQTSPRLTPSMQSDNCW